MATVSRQTHQRIQAKYLESKGWVFYNNIADVPHVSLGQLKFYDFDAAVDHQRHLDEMARLVIYMARPRYHWGIEAARTMGEKL